jgi:phosphopantetheinyl transferase (holo-ACP synthase)
MDDAKPTLELVFDMEDDKPTLPAWVIAAICELTEQIERLASGYACKECLGAKAIAKFGGAGHYWRECHVCKGTGLRQK